jgi:linoleate 10R-lipoxygenase
MILCEEELHTLMSVASTVYKDLSHPPSGYLALPRAPSASPPAASSATPGPRIQYAYRSFDGSDYNPLYPTLGQAGTPYARTVPSTNITPVKSLPDPGLVFDALLRRDGFTPHPDGVSSLFFAFANLVIHSIFNTDHKDVTINKTSSYLDLSILYGQSEDDCNRVRRKDGTGKLHNDAFADYRLLGMPPSTCALLVLFNRNHNVGISYPVR